jgi:putative DNA primase/helicase
MTTFTDRAMEAVNRGLSVIPCKPRSKEPLAPNGAKSRVNTEAGVLAFAARVPEDCNFGICSDENFTIVETDDRAKFFECLGRPMPATLTVSARPNRGYFVFENTDRARSVSGCPKSSEAVFEWRRENQYCCGWGSIHPDTGKPYELIKDLKPVPIPDWLVDRLLELSQNKIQKAIEVTDEEPGSYDLEILGNLLQLWSEQHPAFEFTEGRTQEGSGFYIRCPGVDGWEDGSQHSEAYKGLSSTAACWVTNGYPRWRCHHTHCGSKSWKDLVAALGPDAQRRVLTGSPLFGEARKPDRRATEQFLTDSEGRSSNVDLPGGQAPLPGASENVGSDVGGDPATPRIRAFTDLGNLERFAEQHSGRFKYSEGKGWYAYSNGRWAPESDGAVMVAAMNTARSIRNEPEIPLSENHRGRPPMNSQMWGRQSEGRARIEAMAALARSLPEFRAKEEDFDKSETLFNTANGTIDLETGLLRPHDRNDLLSAISPIEYHPNARCPEWMAFLERVMHGNQDMIKFLQRLAGYTMTGSISEQIFVVNYGKGKNGKSSFVETINKILGDYGATTKFSTFAEKRGGGGIPNDVAALWKARQVVASEGENTTKLAEGLIKSLTGNERITARFLHHEFFSFTPRFTVFLQTNHKPAIAGTDLGMWRRVRFIPWTYVFQDGPGTDKDWAKKILVKEGQGILAWMVRGCIEHLRAGDLQVPETVTQATQDFRDGEDILGAFLRDECTIGESVGDAPAKGLYQIYRLWAQQGGETPLRDRTFKEELDARGVKCHRTKKGIFYKNIRAGIVEVQ